MRKRKLTTVEARMLQMDRKRQQQHQKKTAAKQPASTKQSTTLVLSDDSEDENDDVKITATKPVPVVVVAVAPVVASPAAASATGRPRRSRVSTNVYVASPLKPQVFELLDDSSDDEAPLPFNVLKSKFNAASCSKDALDVLERARQAASSLRNAQTYHAEDIYVPRVQTPPRMPQPSSFAYPVFNKPQQSNIGKALHNTTNLGPNISLKLRRRNGKQFQETVLKHRQREPLQSLLEQYCQQQGLVAQQIISLKFDGQTLNMKNTLVSYDMEAGDLIDVEIISIAPTATIPTRPATATSARTSTRKQNLGPTLALKLQRRTGKRVQETVLKHRQREPLQSLLDQYRTQQKLSATQQISLHFDGESLNMSRTPASYDMEAGDLIDVVIR